LAYQQLLRVITAVLVAALLLAGLAQVFFRYIVQSSLFWTEELSRYLLIWTVFFGAALALENGSHIAVELVIDHFPPRARTFIGRFNLILVIAFCVILITQGWELASRSMNDRSLTLPISVGVVYLAMPIGGVLMLISALRLLLSGATKAGTDARDAGAQVA
jgi:TRAP-type C4-dicarboxylate transport system permease small subunit